MVFRSSGLGGGYSFSRKLAEPHTFGGVATDWLASVRRVCKENERRHVEWLRPLFDFADGELLAGEVGRVIAATGLGPTTQNKLRSTGKLVIDWAQAHGRWMSPNPFALVRRRREIRRAYQVLGLSEVRKLVRLASGSWLRLMACAVLLGARPGELAALQWDDVDLERGTVWIHRSHERSQTKTGRERLFAIPRCAKQFLKQKRGAHPTLVFPGKRGQLGRNAHLSKTFRKLLREAGIERHLRFYDLRHTSATLYREAGADPLVIRLTLGHASRNLTDDLYSHLSLKYQARELSRLCICGHCR